LSFQFLFLFLLKKKKKKTTTKAREIHKSERSSSVVRLEACVKSHKLLP